MNAGDKKMLFVGILGKNKLVWMKGIQIFFLFLPKDNKKEQQHSVMISQQRNTERLYI